MHFQHHETFPEEKNRKVIFQNDFRVLCVSFRMIFVTVILMKFWQQFPLDFERGFLKLERGTGLGHSRLVYNDKKL